MNGNRKAIRITVIGGLATLLLALVVVLMANPAAASGSGDWPPPFMGDWVINQPTTVIDETIYVFDGNITVNSKLSIQNCNVYTIVWSQMDYYDVKVNAAGSLQSNDSYWSSWNAMFGFYWDFYMDGTCDIDNCVFYYNNDVDINGTATFNNTVFDHVYDGFNLTGSMDFTHSDLIYTYGGINLGGTSTFDDAYISNVYDGFKISGSADFNGSTIRYVYDAFNVTGTASFDYQYMYRIYDGFNMMGTVDIWMGNLQYLYEANFTGNVDIAETYFYRMYDGVKMTGNIRIANCDFVYTYKGVYISSNVAIVNSTFNMYYKGIFIDNCDPTFNNVTVYVRSSYSYDYHISTDMSWSEEDRLPMAVGTGIWVDNGVPSFTDVTVEADVTANFYVEYTGTEEDVTLYLMGMVCPVLIDSPAMDVVSGLTVMNSYFHMRSYAAATDPGINPKYFYVDFMGVSAGIGIINYTDTTITDVVSYNNYYGSIYGPYVSGYSYGGGGWRDYGPAVQVGAAAYGSSSTAPDTTVTVSDLTIDDGTNWFGHLYYSGFSGVGVPTLSDTIVIQNVIVNSASGVVFGFDIQPSFAGIRTIDIDLRITDCTFMDVDGAILMYSSNAGPGIDPDMKMVDVTENILIDNNTIDECFSTWTYFIVDSVGTDHKSDRWDRTLTFADNDFINSYGTLFEVGGLDYYDTGTCTLNVVNNNMVNVTDGPSSNSGPYYADDFEVIRFTGNTMTDMHYSQTGDFYDVGGDDNGVKPVDWLFKNNVITNCTNERWSEIIFLEFGGAVVVEGNEMSMGNGFLSMWHETMYTGVATLDIVDNEFYQMSAYMAEFGNTDEGNVNFVVTVKDNTVYECEDFFLNFWGSASNINPYDRDATYVIEDNLVHNNTGGFINVWGKVTVQDNMFFDNAGPLLYIEYINLNPPVVLGNQMANNMDLFMFVAKDKGFELVPYGMSNEMLSCTGTAFSFTNMEVTLTRVDISGADQHIWAFNSVVNAYSSSIDGTKCTVVADGKITTWWPIEVKVTWGDDMGVDSTTPVSEALVVFYDAQDVYYTSVYAGTDGILPEHLYMEWTVDTGGIYEFSPLEVKAASSGATNDTVVTLNMDLVGPDAVHIVLWDAFAPTVAITEPYDGSIFNKDSIEAYGFVTEVGSGLDIIEYSLTGSTWLPLEISDSGDWSLPLTELGEGDVTLWVRASDIASNLATTSITITIDTMPPDLTISSVPERTNNPDLFITGTIEVGADLYVNGIFVETAESSSLMIAHTLHEGSNIILIEAMDSAHNVAFETIETVLDTQLPTLVLTGPAYGTVTNQETVMVTGIVEGGTTLTVGGTPVIPDTDGSFSHAYTLSSGDNMIEVKATDLASNVATVTVLVELDLLPPSVEIVEPSEDFITSETFIEVNIRADEDATLWLNGRPTVNDGDFWRTVLLLEGDNTIVVKGMDPAGNVAEDSVMVKRDTMPPDLMVLVPADLVTWSNQMMLTVSGLALNATEGVFVNGEAVDSYNPSTGAFSHSVTITSGENNITVEAKDEVHVVTHMLKAMVSTSTPKLVINTVESPVTTSSVTISGETDLGIETVMVEVGTKTMEFGVMYDGTFSFTLNLEDGNYIVKVSVDDRYGNTATEQTNSFDVKEKDYFPDDGGEVGESVSIEPIHIGLLLAVIGITLIVAALWATWKISRRGE